MIPSTQVCLQLMDKYKMLDHIKDHSIVVAKVAHLIARILSEYETTLSIAKTTAGALMHDIGKTPALHTRHDHAEIGRQICLDNHLDEIADIVGEHVRIKGNSLNGKISEKLIVYYADKRVKHDEVVSLEERLAYIIKRYAKNQTRLSLAIKMNFEVCKKIEKRLFDILDFKPELLAVLAEKEDITA